MKWKLLILDISHLLKLFVGVLYLLGQKSVSQTLDALTPRLLRITVN